MSLTGQNDDLADWQVRVQGLRCGSKVDWTMFTHQKQSRYPHSFEALGHKVILSLCSQFPRESVGCRDSGGPSCGSAIILKILWRHVQDLLDEFGQNSLAV